MSSGAVAALADMADEGRWFASMLRIRRVEEEIARRYPEQQMRTPVHLCVGQEAVPVGVSHCLRRSDKVLSGHRSHGQYLAKGGDLGRMIAEIYGRASGCSGGKGGSQHLVDLECGFLGSAPILASTLSIGVGVAWALDFVGSGDVCVVYFGDAATEEGVFHEAMSFASLHALPVVFVCENNLYSTQAGMEVRQPMRPLMDLARAHAVSSSTTDGNDAIAVVHTAAGAIDRARNGDGPSFLVFDTYRFLEHVGPGTDTHLGYRSEAEVATWRQRDPIDRLRLHLLSTVSDWHDREAAMEADIGNEVDAAFEFALASPFPDVSEMLSQVYAPRNAT